MLNAPQIFGQDIHDTDYINWCRDTLNLDVEKEVKLKVKVDFIQEEQKMKYKVNFSGFAYVEADNEDEAAENYNDFEVYREEEIESIEEVDEFAISMW